MITIKTELTEEAKAVVRSLQRLPAAMVAGIVKAMDLENQHSIGISNRDYMSFPKDEPPVAIGLRSVSGHLRRSLRARPAVATGDQIKTIQSAIGSNLEYAAVHEFGFEGMVNVPAHLRKNVQEATVFGKRRLIRKADIQVRAGQRHMNLPAREYTQKGIRDNQRGYTMAISQAILTAWQAP